ncbi:MAG: hypothetical protein Q8N53_04960 [Longimicrobiales bacterium]|nr:hypothetical protein [Longimicrobiales bacterium]
MRRKAHGIFCLEDDWWKDFNRTSTVQPILSLISQGVLMDVPHVHRDVGTVEELAYYLRRWSQAGSSQYGILYLAFHGRQGAIFVGDRRRKNAEVTLDDLAEMLGEGLTGRIVHFGSCQTMGVDKRHIRRFLKHTGLVAATGFKSQVDWLSSSVFDVLLFEAMLRHSLTPSGARAIRANMWDEYGALCRRHDFRMIVRAPKRPKAGGVAAASG